MSSIRKNIKLFLAFALPVYLMILVNSMVNMHVHVLSNGMVVKHAHPLCDGEHEDGSHEHSKDEFSFYEGFFADFYDNSSSLDELIVDLPLISKIGEPLSVDYYQFHHNFSQLRGPPQA